VCDGSTHAFSLANHHAGMQPGAQPNKQCAKHQRMHFAHQVPVQGKGCATTWGMGGDLRYTSGALSGLIHRTTGHDIADHHRLLCHHLGTTDVKECWRLS